MHYPIATRPHAAGMLSFAVAALLISGPHVLRAQETSSAYDDYYRDSAATEADLSTPHDPWTYDPSAWEGSSEPSAEFASEFADAVKTDASRADTSNTAADACDDCDGSDACDHCGGKGGAKGKGKKDPAATAYKGLFYDNDFTYLRRPGYRSPYLADSFKQLQPLPGVTLDVGGEFRMRNHVENNIGRSRLDGLDNEFLLMRTRLYMSGSVGGLFRAYGEMIDATSSFEDLPPRSIEENRADFINLFGEMPIMDIGSGTLTARVGRQELLYGVERLVSPLDWSNTRRTFDGANLFWKGEKWRVDGFWTRPVPFGQHVPNDHNFDNPDLSQEFTGLYASRKTANNGGVDFYYLRLAEYDGPTGDFDANTFGARWWGARNDWLWDFEGGYQFGEFGALDQSAGFYVVGLGRKFSNVRGTPTFWVYYDWASGDSDPNDGKRGTFNQLFPLGHKYLGFMDLVARQNIRAWNFLATMQPHKRVKLLAWWYIFRLEEARDALYNAGGAIIRNDPTGVAGTDVGQELDLTALVTITPRVGILFGYSHFFAGDYLVNTAPFNGNDADFYYTQLTTRF